VLPAASIIDWTDLGSRIGDREAEGKRPLVPATMRRIQVGLDMFAEPTMLNVNHGVDEDGRPYPAAAGPFPARTTKTGDGLACPPMLVPAGGGWNDTATSVERPMRTRTTRDIEGHRAAAVVQARGRILWAAEEPSSGVQMAVLHRPASGDWQLLAKRSVGSH
jgi:DNA (cytosine-5)-methyltransferase 1